MTVIPAHVSLVALHLNPQQLEQEVLGPGDEVWGWQHEHQDLQEVLQGFHGDLVVNAVLDDEEKAGLEGVRGAWVGGLGEAGVPQANLSNNMIVVRRHRHRFVL